jgi:uncharacterized protein YjiS (DUF1127 family)
MRKMLTAQEPTTSGSHALLRPDAANSPKDHDFFIRILVPNLIRMLDALGEWQERSAERRRLAAFDTRMLGDIGIDRATAATEAEKPFWRS